MNTSTILLTGATGRTGRRLASRLGSNARSNVRLASRSGTPSFSWTAPETWHDHLSGADAAFLCYAPDVADPEAPEILGAFSAAALGHGVSRLVLQSGRGDSAASPSEEAVRTAFPDAVVVRSAWFQQNFSEHFLYPQVLDGRLRVPVDQVAEPFVDLEDSAEALEALLTDAETYAAAARGNGILEFTGPGSLTFGEVAGLLTSRLGRRVVHEPTAPADFVAAAGEYGLSPAEAEGIAWLFAEVMNGAVSNVTTDLEHLLGRPARPMTEYVDRTAASGRWSIPPEPAAKRTALSSTLNRRAY